MEQIAVSRLFNSVFSESTYVKIGFVRKMTVFSHAGEAGREKMGFDGCQRFSRRHLSKRLVVSIETLRGNEKRWRVGNACSFHGNLSTSNVFFTFSLKTKQCCSEKRQHLAVSASSTSRK